MKILHVFTLASTAESFFDGQFAYLSDVGYELQMAASTQPSKEFCQRNHIVFHQIPIARRVDISADFKAILNLVKLIRREKYDAVFGHTPKGALVAMCASWLSSVRVRVYFRHGLIYTTAVGLKRKILKSIEQLTSFLSTHIINVSPSLSELAVIDCLNSERKQMVIGSGTCGGIDTTNIFNPSLISPKSQSELKQSIVGDSGFVVGFCGRLCRDKGIIELIDGFNLFQSNYPYLNSKLLLVGPYDERDVLPDNIKEEIANNPNIVAIGRKDQSQLPYLYSLMDVFVFPSYREGFGMSVIEASAMQVPILVSRSHGCIDSIRKNISGLYIDITAESIASELSIMLDPNLRVKLGKGGRNFVINNYERTNMWPLIKQMYKNMLNDVKI